MREWGSQKHESHFAAAHTANHTMGWRTCEPRVEREDLGGLAGNVVDDLDGRLQPLVDVGPVVDDRLLVGTQPDDEPHGERL